MSDAEYGVHSGSAFRRLDGVFAPHQSTKMLDPKGTEQDGTERLGALNLLDDHGRTLPTNRAQISSIVVSLATAHLRSPHSKRAYRQAVMEFLAWCAATGTATLTKASVHEYVDELNRLRMSPATVNVALCAIGGRYPNARTTD